MAEIGNRERGGHPPEEWSYHERWLASLERILDECGIVTRRELEERIERVTTEYEHA